MLRDLFPAHCMFLAGCIACAALIAGCASTRVGSELHRTGDEIVVAGRYFHTGVPVVLWTDAGGYDAYRVEKRFTPIDKSDWDSIKDSLETPNRYGTRKADLSAEELERVRAGGWDLDLLRAHVDQFVIHYDVAGTSRSCFRVLHDARGLSVHFMVDIDGTIYQTLDVKERAWHASHANDRSVGVEVAQIGAYPMATFDKSPLTTWYVREPIAGKPGTVGATRVRIQLPASMGDGGVRTPNFVATPARDDLITGDIHGTVYGQYDFTNEQYRALAHLAAALHAALPRIELRVPREADGSILRRAMSDDEWRAYHGILGHCHLTTNKVDPGPAFNWNNLLVEAETLARKR